MTASECVKAKCANEKKIENAFQELPTLSVLMSILNLLHELKLISE